MEKPKNNFMGQGQLDNFTRMSGDTQPYADTFMKNFQKPKDLGTQTGIIGGSVQDINQVPTMPAPILDVPVDPSDSEMKNNAY
jgi:hypothetical protein|tara:strand:+ start:224 stop:472 length:249 start_codon:yes stop_codon:yes gene_type:complete